MRKGQIFARVTKTLTFTVKSFDMFDRLDAILKNMLTSIQKIRLQERQIFPDKAKLVQFFTA